MSTNNTTGNTELNVLTDKKQGTNKRSSIGSSSSTSSPSSNRLNSSSSKKQQNKEPTTSDGKLIVYLPRSDDAITDRNILTRLPEKEACDLYVGDIIWSKVSGYPWWPCMVTIDPLTGKYSRFVSTEKPLYHVQYFGSKATRAYTSPGLTMAFEGREKYELELDRIKNTPMSQKSQRKAALNRLIIKPAHKKEWKYACNEAEEALKLDRENRIKELTFCYIMVKDDGTTPILRDGTKTPKSKKIKKPENPLNVYDFVSDADEDFDDEGSSPTLCLWSGKRANRKGDYDVYVTQTRSKVEEENPDASDSEIEHMLKTRWSHMSDDLKAKYFVRESNGEETTPISSKKKSAISKTPKSEKTPRGRKRKNAKEKSEIQSNGDISITEGNGDASENESALVIADTTTPKKSRKSKGEASEGSAKRSAKTPKVSEVTKTPKEVKASKSTLKSSKSDRTPKEDENSTTKKSEGTSAVAKTAISKSKVKDEVKESSPRKRPSSIPVDKTASPSEKPKRSRKSTTKENGKSIEKKPKSVEKSRKRKEEKTSDVEISDTDQYKNSKENDKEKSNSVKRKSSVPTIDTAESEETRTSEDASSLSEMEAIERENRELNDRVCVKCNEEALEDYIQCSGLCLSYYHNKCLPKTFNSESSLCQECASGTHLCFICHSYSPEVKKCSDSTCGRFYHLKCLQNNYPHKVIKDENNEGFICPLHSCLTCYVEHQDDQVHSFMRKRLLKCLKCPSAYHLTDACLSAGSVTISFSYIICPEHIPSRKIVNVNWCFSCNQGGSLICCERCPSAFHQACLETPLPEGNFFCGDCVVRRQLHYNDIVWVKFASYRWWPGKVCHPKNCPENVMKLSHSTGEFPVYFFGSHDYYWIHRGKAFPFVEGDLTKAAALCKGAKPDFKAAISEAIEAFKSWQEARMAVIKRKVKPPPYVYLRANKRVGKAPKVSPRDADDDTEPIVCQCKSDGDRPCGVDEDCFNRLTLIECDPSRCNAGDKCRNRRFRKREYAKVQPFKTESRGWGLKALQDIKKGTFVIEYVGELIDEAECENRIKSMIEKHEPNFYFLTIDRDTIIDAGPKGNLARFMNHSCSPNCETQKWVVGGATRVGLFAIQDIPEGAELTFNYNLHCRGNEKTACNCGAKNCSGFLGVRPNKIPDDESTKKQAKADKSKAKSKPKNNPKKEFEIFHEDECFKCGEGGQLVMCDKRKCPKSYHLVCLDLTKLPRGQWLCPWHHCDDFKCRKPATRFCDLCPTSFCNEHLSKNGNTQINKNEKGQQVCYEHTNSTEIASNELVSPPIKPEEEQEQEQIKENGETSHEDAADSIIEHETEKVTEKDVEEEVSKEEESANNVESMEIDTPDDLEKSQSEEKSEGIEEQTKKEDEPTTTIEEIKSKEPEIEPEMETKKVENEVELEKKETEEISIKEQNSEGESRPGEEKEKEEPKVEIKVEEKKEAPEVENTDIPVQKRIFEKEEEKDEKLIEKDEEKMETELPQEVTATVVTENESIREKLNSTIESKENLVTEVIEKSDKIAVELPLEEKMETNEIPEENGDSKMEEESPKEDNPPQTTSNLLLKESKQETQSTE